VLCHQRGERLYECMGSRCPSVVLWPPCSGVEWRVLEPTIRVWRSDSTRKQREDDMHISSHTRRCRSQSPRSGAAASSPHSPHLHGAGVKPCRSPKPTFRSLHAVTPLQPPSLHRGFV
jgi:hypothetical protein